MRTLLCFTAITFGLGLAQADDFSDKSELKVKWGLTTGAVFTSSDSTLPVTTLPSSAYVRKTGEDEKNNRTQVTFSYLDKRIDCLGVFNGGTLKDQITNYFGGAIDSNYSKHEIDLNINGLLRNANKDTSCYVSGEGWVSSKELEGKNFKTQASECPEGNCEVKESKTGVGEARKASLAAVEKLQKDKSVQYTPPPQSKSCGQPGSPVMTQLKTISYGREYKPHLVKNEKISDKGVPYRDAKVPWLVKWECETRFPAKCARPGVYPLQQSVELANHFYSKGEKHCEFNMEKYYDACSPLAGMDLSERKKHFRERANVISEHVMGQLARSASQDISPKLLGCIVNRENHTFEPLKLNYRACDPRNAPGEIPKHKLREGVDHSLMKTWKSDAHGVGQTQLEAIVTLWRDSNFKLRDKKPFGSKQTFAEKYKKPEALFMAMSNNLDLQIEVMTYHLHYNRSLTDFRTALLKYDADHKETWLPAVTSCAAKPMMAGVGQ